MDLRIGRGLARCKTALLQHRGRATLNLNSDSASLSWPGLKPNSVSPLKREGGLALGLGHRAFDVGWPGVLLGQPHLQGGIPSSLAGPVEPRFRVPLKPRWASRAQV